MSSNCNLSGLETYIPSAENPWDLKKIGHLYKRLAMGIRPTEALPLLNQSPSDIIDDLIENTLNASFTTHPEESFILSENVSSQRRLWSVGMISELYNKGVQGRMFLFWHNHFVTIYDRVPRYLYNYTSLLQEHSLGNFKDFTRAIGTDDQMLQFLNGDENVKDAPNENYARELYELFTLGEGNGYTEFDITETARALTGYNGKDDSDVNVGSPIYFIEDNWDNGEKTIFNRTGNWGYDDVIDILFEEKAELISVYITETLYRYFVHPDLPEGTTIIEDLAQTFRDNDFEIIPLLKQLFKSEHFFDASAMDVIIKSPLDQSIMLHRCSNLTHLEENDSNRFSVLADDLGQILFTHPDVFGWPGDRSWISPPNFINTWTVLEEYIDFYHRNADRDREDFRDLATSLTDNTTDFKVVSNAIMDWFLPAKLLSTEDYTIAQDIFKSDIPDNYFVDGTWTINFFEVPLQVSLLLKHIIRLPEFHIK